jgi:tetratricopeptide (TPR) repeat protein
MLYRAFIIISLLSSAALAGEPKPGTLSKELIDYLAKPEAEINIGMGAMLISKEQYPDILVNVELANLDVLGKRLFNELTKAGTVSAKLEALKIMLFKTEQFQLPEKDDAADFLLSAVLKNKRGNCLGLSVLCLALAERAGFKLHGVPVPSRLSGAGHLLVRYDDGTTRENFDPTKEGAAYPDDYYQGLFKIRPEDLKSGYILGNASKKDVLCLLLVNLGGARVEADAPLSALPLLEQAIAMKPDYAYAHNNLGAARLRMGDIAGAAACYTKALTLQPGLLAARVGLAQIALQRGDLETATKESAAVLTEESDNPQAKTVQANIDIARGDYRAAAVTLREVVDAIPTDLRTRCNLGKTLMLAGDFQNAERAYKEVLEIDAQNAQAHFGLGEILRATGKAAEGDAEFAAVLKLDPNHAPTLLAQAMSALQNKKYDLAEANCETVLKKQPYYVDALRLLSQALIAERKYADAIKRLTTASKAHPENLGILVALAEARMGNHEFADAIALLQPAADKAPEGDRRPLLQRLAICYGKQSDHRKALDIAEKLLKDKPSDIISLKVAANAYEGLRNAPKAIEYYKKILELVPDDDQAKKGISRLGG